MLEISNFLQKFPKKLSNNFSHSLVRMIKEINFLPRSPILAANTKITFPTPNARIKIMDLICFV